MCSKIIYYNKKWRQHYHTGIFTQFTQWKSKIAKYFNVFTKLVNINLNKEWRAKITQMSMHVNVQRKKKGKIYYNYTIINFD